MKSSLGLFREMYFSAQYNISKGVSFFITQNALLIQTHKDAPNPEVSLLPDENFFHLWNMRTRCILSDPAMCQSDKPFTRAARDGSVSEGLWVGQDFTGCHCLLSCALMPDPRPAQPAEEPRAEGSFRHSLAAWVAIMALIDSQVCLGHPEGQECQGSL